MNISNNLQIKIIDTPFHGKIKKAFLNDELHKFKYLGDIVTLEKGASYVKHLEGYGPKSHKDTLAYLKSLDLKYEMSIPEWKDIRAKIENKI